MVCWGWCRQPCNKLMTRDVTTRCLTPAGVRLPYEGMTYEGLDPSTSLNGECVHRNAQLIWRYCYQEANPMYPLYMSWPMVSSVTHLAWSYTMLKTREPPVHHQPQTWCTGIFHWNGHSQDFAVRNNGQWWVRNRRGHRGPQCGQIYTPRMARWNTSHRKTNRCTAWEKLDRRRQFRKGEIKAWEATLRQLLFKLQHTHFLRKF